MFGWTSDMLQVVMDRFHALKNDLFVFKTTKKK